MRFTIRLKIILLSVLSFAALIGIAMFSSLVIYRKRAKADYIDAVDRAVEEAKEIVKNEVYMEFLNEIKASIQNVYESDPINKDDFSSFEEKYQYYANKYAPILLYKSFGFGMSQALLRNQTDYLNISGALSSISNATGGIATYIGFYEYIETGDIKSERFIYLVDSRYRLTETIDEKKYDYKDIKLPGSYYEIQDADTIDIDVPDEDYYGCIFDGKTSRYVDIFNKDGSWLATVFIEYDESIIDDSVQEFATTELIAFIILTIVLIVAYVILSSIFIVKNIKHLTKATDLFKNSLFEGNNLEVVVPDIKTHDEIKDLAVSYVLLEEAIVEYTSKIEEATREKEKINAELAVATKIQLEALPKNKLADQNVSICASIESAKEVGGDFYDYFYIDQNHLAVIISDVSGKGIPAALFMMRAKELLKTKLLANLGIEKACYEVNNELLKNNEEGLFITAFVGILNTLNHELTYVNAGHEKPYVIKENELIKLTGNSNFILGGLENFKYKEEKVKLALGAKLFLYTDGLNESINDKEEEFGYTRIEDNLKQTATLPLEKILDNMKQSLKEFTSEKEAFDDVTMIALEIRNNEFKLEFENPTYEIIDTVTEKFNESYKFISQEDKSKISIIIDELLNNIVSYEKNEKLIVKVFFKLEGLKLVMTFMSNGEPFNPLDNEKKYATNEEGLEAGGFGISIVKEFANALSYQRKDNYNVLIVEKEVL